MTGTICSVANCKSNREKTKKAGADLRFFTFPKDEQVKKEWVRLCYRNGKFNPQNKRICGKHFALDQFDDHVHAKLTNSLPRKLKANAVPSLFLTAKDTVDGVSPRMKRLQKREGRKLVEKILMDADQPVAADEKPVIQKYPSVVKKNPHVVKKNSPVVNKNPPVVDEKPVVEDNLPLASTSSTKTPYEILFEKYDALEKQNQSLQTEIATLRTSYNASQQRLQAALAQGNTTRKSMEARITQLLSDFLTPNQVQMVLKRKTKARWTSNEIARAFTLRYFSKRAYIYMRQTLKYPLPGLSTLQSWASNVDLRRGILVDILKFMELSGVDQTDFQKLTILSFDQMPVSSIVEYDQRADEIVGPHSYMQIIMARGLFESWKQPVFVGFDTRITKSILDDVITKLNSIKYKVVGCVSDCSGTNVELWQELNISMEKTYYTHPIEKHKIYMFADAPHLLKLIRNCFLDYGFDMVDGTLINVDTIRALIDAGDAEINAACQLDTLHITCEGPERDDVTLAAQLMSHATAAALKRYLPAENELAQSTADFITLINRWFDLMSTSEPATSSITNAPYGEDLEEQYELLEEIKETFVLLRPIGKQQMDVFQMGVIISCTSLQQLFSDMQEEYGAQCVLTHRLHQACLENLFGQVKAAGGLREHPGPLNALYRLRMVLVGENRGILRHNNNNTSVERVEPLQEDQCILASALAKAKVIAQIDKPVLDLGDEAEDEAVEESLEENGNESSLSYSQDVVVEDVVENNELAHIAAYLAKQLKKQFPDLATPTSDPCSDLRQIHSYAAPTRDESLPVESCTIEPTVAWQNDVEQMNAYFNQLHADDFQFKVDIVKRTAAFIANNLPDISKKLITAFVRQRVFLKVRHTNLKNSGKKIHARKRPIVAATAGAEQKRSKIVYEIVG